MKARAFVAFVLLALLVGPVAGQTASWCRSFDFTQGAQSWSVSYANSYGRYTAGAGFSVTNYGGTDSYEHAGSIRIHRDFSGTVTQVFTFASQPDYDHVFIDYDSAVSDGEPLDDDVFASGVASPAGISINPTAVSSRFGLEYVKTEAALPMRTIITGIVLAGTGANPFGANNCESLDGAGEGETGIYSFGVDGPFPAIFESLTNTTNGVNGLPTDLTSVVPSTDGSQLFAYAKWMLSPAAADEWAGPLAPIVQHLSIIVTLAITLLGVYIVTYLIIYGVRFAIWLLHWLLRILDLALQILQAGGSFIVQGARAVISALGIGAFVQLPPTPTPQPPGVEFFAMPENLSLWSSTDSAIQLWNWTGTWGQIFQVMILLLFVYLGVRVLLAFANTYMRRDSEL